MCVYLRIFIFVLEIPYFGVVCATEVETKLPISILTWLPQSTSEHFSPVSQYGECEKGIEQLYSSLSLCTLHRLQCLFRGLGCIAKKVEITSGE